MSIPSSFTCVACEYRRLPFDPQESAGTCPSCGQQYVAQPERVSKSKLRDELKAVKDREEAGSFFEAQEQAGVLPPPAPAWIRFPAPDRDETLARRAEKQEGDKPIEPQVQGVSDTEAYFAREAKKDRDWEAVNGFDEARKRAEKQEADPSESGPEFGERLADEVKRQEDERPKGRMDLSALDHVKRAVRWTSH